VSEKSRFRAPAVRPRTVLVLIAALLAAVSLAVVLDAGGSASADRAARRGAPVRVDRGPARLDRAASLRAVGSVRRGAHLPAVSGSSCLDAAAARLVAEFARGAVPTSGVGGCGSAWGWVAGSDPSGAEMARAVVTRPAGGGRSPFASRVWRHVGVAVGRRVVAGVPTGYVLVWVLGR
jgi:hypothetical protein